MQTIQSRTWGTRFDSLVSSPSSPTLKSTLSCESVALTSDTNIAHASNRKQHERMPHDSSVFVGSLPCNIEHQELNRLLSEHLSGYTEPQNIKVVRDSKGGTCAFIQCQDAASAARLIDTLHSLSPRQFMGRYLRFEPARAFRTLLISYRCPRQYVPSDSTGRVFGDFKRDRLVELELPSAMKLWRNAGAKYLSILYNSDACTAAEVEGLQVNVNYNANAPNLFLSPLLFDAETLQAITALFGPVEYFAPYSPEKENLGMPFALELKDIMDSGCWEVKWRYRDDCVSALMQSHNASYHNMNQAHSNATSYSFHVQAGSNNNPTKDFGGIMSSPESYLPPSSRFTGVGDKVSTARDSPLTPTLPRSAPGDFLSTPRSSSISDDRDWTRNVVSATVTPSRARAHSLSYRSGSSLRVGDNADDSHISGSTAVNWSENDFPPLGNMSKNQETQGHLWGDRMTAAEGEDHDDSTLALFGTPRLPASQVDPAEREDEGQDVDVDIPPTPEFGTSPVTPKTPGSLVPLTPTTGSYIGDFQSVSSKGYHGKGVSMYTEEKRESALDPTTIFVGGLEMYGPNAWDEERVRNFFSRFGGVETVKVVRPVNKRSAFAFVKFDNTESPIRAVNEEHNRVLDGRPIRVQLRDWNPPHRAVWKFSRGRGRFQQFGATRHSVEQADDQSEDFCTNTSLLSLNSEDQVADVDTGSFADKSSISESKDVNLKPRSENSIVKWSTDAQNSGDVDRGEAQRTDSTSIEKSSTHDSSTLRQSAVPQSDDLDKPWMQGTHPPITTSSSYASVSGPTPMAYPIPAVGYYPQQGGWMPGFAPQIQYPVPFAYPGTYAYPQYPNPAGSDTSGPPSGTQTPFPQPGAMYAGIDIGLQPFIPYPAYSVRTVSFDQTQSQSSGTPQPQAPLLPTGFIQGDQGMLVPVYPPDALDQYMSGTQGQQVAAAGPPVQAQNTPPWRPYSQPPVYPPTIPIASIPGLHPPPFQAIAGTQPGVGNHGWIPHHGPSMTPQAPHPSMQGSARQHVPHTVPGGSSVSGLGPLFEQRNVPPRRQYRRVSQPDYNKNNTNTRGPPNRYPRGGMATSYSSYNVDRTASQQNFSPHKFSEHSNRDSGGRNDWSQAQWNLSQ
ncbi:hypothetical protein SERLA73DRAFT_157880 [Serpula lacrymans var. lacrymans S7.3]|uniref:RRM domain-containing protein n=1 Tax=Serpula lacrymans var. lacrymans (strain S7.3) TaxID=936435 RepID=F8PFL6_SERL3|nr:hypothetical protein SERLA73DRAFT_157880 [Serpula lacrymans var. lacrymans S7.3]